MRVIRIAAAQMGTTNLWDPRSKTLARMISLLEQAKAKGAQLVVFPETAFTTFFPRHLPEKLGDLDSWYEKGDIVTSRNVKPFFDAAQRLGLHVCVGYAELTEDEKRYNTRLTVDANGKEVSKYRKVHLPGTSEPFDDPEAINQLEKKYFLPGDIGFKAFRLPDLAPKKATNGVVHGDQATNGRTNGDHEATNEVVHGDHAASGRTHGEHAEGPICGQLICNDRRWAEAWRVLGLQGAEVVMCGYNTASWAPQLFGHDPACPVEEQEKKQLFHSHLVAQAFAYTNACFGVVAARCGLDDGKFGMISGSMIVEPEGMVLAEAGTKEDEIVVAACDLDACKQGKERTFNFGKHRRTEYYRLITEQTDVEITV